MFVEPSEPEQVLAKVMVNGVMIFGEDKDRKSANLCMCKSGVCLFMG